MHSFKSIQSCSYLAPWSREEEEEEENEACLLRAKLHFARNCCSRVGATPELSPPLISITSIAHTTDALCLVECRGGELGKSESVDFWWW